MISVPASGAVGVLATPDKQNRVQAGGVPAGLPLQRLCPDDAGGAMAQALARNVTHSSLHMLAQNEPIVPLIKDLVSAVCTA
jgi:hypothetical protein